VNTLAKPPQLIVPAGFHPRDYLPYALRRDHDCARWLVSTILRKLASRPGKTLRPVALYSRHLERMMGRRYAMIVKALIDGHVVSRTHHYTVGERSFGYYLDRRFVDQPHIRVEITDDRLRNRIERFKDECRAKQLARFRPIHRELFRLQRQLRVDEGEAASIVAGLPPESNPFDVQGILLRDIIDHRYRMSIGPTSHRIYNAITSLARPARKALRIGGAPLAGIDLKCCQPALLAMLMQGNLKITQIAKTAEHSKVYTCPDSLPALPPDCVDADVRDFAFRTADGSLYDFLVERVPGQTRALLKRGFLRDFLAKKGCYDSPVENAVRNHWPSVHSFVRTTNRDDHAALIRALQRTEAWLVIDRVCGRLVDSRPDDFAITLHDAVYSHPDHTPAVRTAFGDTFDEMGFSIGLDAA
jgi:hypothetical protein